MSYKWHRQKILADQKTTQIMRRAEETGNCVICGKPQREYPDGHKSLTCLTNLCYYKWLPGGRDKVKQIESGRIPIGDIYGRN